MEFDGFIKVIFELPEGSAVGAESMWLRQVRGDDLAGVGILDNRPAFVDGVKHGDLLAYHSPVSDHRPYFYGPAVMTDDGYVLIWNGEAWVDNVDPESVDMTFGGSLETGPQFD